jgi:hypothetical protein
MALKTVCDYMSRYGDFLCGIPAFSLDEMRFGAFWFRVEAI